MQRNYCSKWTQVLNQFDAGINSVWTIDATTKQKTSALFATTIVIANRIFFFSLRHRGTMRFHGNEEVAFFVSQKMNVNAPHPTNDNGVVLQGDGRVEVVPRDAPKNGRRV